MQFIITDEDRKLADLIVERFDPAKAIRKPPDVSDEDWEVYMEPKRSELRNEIKAVQLASALKAAGLVPDTGEETIARLMSLFRLNRLGIKDHDLWARVTEQLEPKLGEVNFALGELHGRALAAVEEAV